MPAHRYPEQQEENTLSGPDRSGRPRENRYQIINIDEEGVPDEKQTVQEAGQEAGNTRPVVTRSPGAEV